MATELEKLARIYQGKGNTPQADVFRALAAVVRATGGPESLIAVDTLNASELIEREKKALKAFFGKEIPVVTPPSKLFETLKIAETVGFGGIFDPIYFPEVKFGQGSNYPGWQVKPEEWYWRQIRAGKISKDAATLGGYWGLFDKSRRPDYDSNGEQMFQEDPLAPTLAEARETGKIQSAENVPKSSRFAVSPNEQDQAVFPVLRKILQLTESVAIVRRPTEIEFNFAGNLRYPHLGEADTWEWLQDKFVGGLRLVGGHSGYGGVADVGCPWSGPRHVLVAFRPLVVFSPKLG